MPRPLVLGNGRMHVAIDHGLSIRDLYWPYVGLHNHLSGNRCRIGLWAEGAFRWLSDPSWRRKLGYVEGALTTDVTLEHDELEVRVRLNDSVLHDFDCLFRWLRIENLAERERTFRIYFAHDFHIAETD